MRVSRIETRRDRLGFVGIGGRAREGFALSIMRATHHTHDTCGMCSNTVTDVTNYKIGTRTATRDFYLNRIE